MRSVPFLTNFLLARPRKRLWMSAGVLGVFLLTLVVGNQFIATDKSVTREMLGHDFLAFYTAGTFVRDGRARDLYNLEAVKTFEQSTAHSAGLEVGKSFGPWWNPPFYALIFEPLAAMPYARALDLWRWISVGAVAIAIVLLAQFVARSSLSSRWQQWMLVPAVIVVSMPFIQSFSHGQNTFTSLLLLTATVALWRADKKLIGGIVCGFLFYKPQLGAVVAIVMVLDLGWRQTLTGLCITGVTLIAVNCACLPGTLGDWLHQMPRNVHWIQIEQAYLWERHVTLKAFWRLLLQGRSAGEPQLITTILTYLSLAAVGGGLGWSILHGPKNCLDAGLRRDRLITATITAMPLLMPFYFDYDLLLLAIPATLYAAERISHPHQAETNDRWLSSSWVALFFWLFINPAFAFHTHVSGSVILLTTIAVQSIRRVNRAAAIVIPSLFLRSQELAIAA